MNRRSFLKSAKLAGLAIALPSTTFAEAQKKSAPAATSSNPNTILLKDYRPVSIHKVPITHIDKAKFPIIDMHSHPEPKTDAEINTWLKNMDEVGVEKTIVLTMATGKPFDEINAKYSKHPDRFEIWCGLDFAGYNTPAFPDSAVKELTRCHDAGAKGVGEIHDKGQGLRSGKSVTHGLHPDDPRVDAIWEKAAELRMPISLHVADPIWMYQPMDKHNDGLMNAYEWRLDNQPATSPISTTISRISARRSTAIPISTPTFPPVTQRPRPSRASPRSSTRNIPTASFTAPTWATRKRCTASPSASSNRKTNTSTKPSSSATTGRSTDWA
jgi:hypothetical protein